MQVDVEYTTNAAPPLPPTTMQAELCGGFNTIDVYRLSDETPDPDPTCSGTAVDAYKRVRAQLLTVPVLRPETS